MSENIMLKILNQDAEKLGGRVEMKDRVVLDGLEAGLVLIGEMHLVDAVPFVIQAAVASTHIDHSP